MKISGIVQKGKQRGKDLGFPTANIPLTRYVDDGIYVSYVLVDGKKYPSLTFIGIAETFNETDRFAETYILDFDQDIYGKELEITILKKLRENKKFSSVNALVEQMNNDTIKARTFFKHEARNTKFETKVKV